MSGRLSAEQRNNIRASDPLIISLLESAVASPWGDDEIEIRAGCAHGIISRLRKGGGSTRLVTFVSLAEVLGLKVVVVREAR